MSGKIYVKETTDLGDFSKEGIMKIGKIAVEAMNKTEKWKPIYNKLMASQEGLSKETITVAETDLFTTAISGFIEQRLRPELVASGVIKVIDNFQTKGQNALKVPLRDALITALDLPDSGQVAYDAGAVGSTTITLTYKYAANSLTHEILKFANVDLIAEELGEIGDALARKMDSDIIAALAAATISSNTYTNYLGLSVGTYISYTAIVNGLNGAYANYAKPDTILMNHSTFFGTLMKTAEFKGAANIVGTLIFKGAATEAFPIPMTVMGLKVLLSQQVGANDVYLVDSARCGYLVKAGGVETFDGRISGYLSFEVIGALNYGVSVVQPKAVYRIAENEKYHA